MYLVLTESEERVRSPRTTVIDRSELPCGCWRLNMSSGPSTRTDSMWRKAEEGHQVYVVAEVGSALTALGREGCIAQTAVGAL